MEWLESYLKDYRGTFIAVSHDRRFLDSPVERVIELHQGKGRKGNIWETTPTSSKNGSF